MPATDPDRGQAAATRNAGNPDTDRNGTEGAARPEQLSDLDMTAVGSQPNVGHGLVHRPRMRFTHRGRLISAHAVQHAVTTPRRGWNRNEARELLFNLLDQMHQDSPPSLERRVYFRLLLGSGARLTLGGKGGYSLARVVSACRAEGEDPLTWLHSQILGRDNDLYDRDPIVGVDLVCWQRPTRTRPDSAETSKNAATVDNTDRAVEDQS